MDYEIKCASPENLGPKFRAKVAAKSCGLWYDDMTEAGVVEVYYAKTEDGEVLGYQTVSGKSRCVAIEAWAPGVGSALVEASGCWMPEKDEAPEFWAKMAARYGE